MAPAAPPHAWLARTLDALERASAEPMVRLPVHAARRAQAYTHWRLHDSGLLHGFPVAVEGAPSLGSVAAGVAWHNASTTAPQLTPNQVRPLVVRALGLTAGLDTGAGAAAEKEVAHAWNALSGALTGVPTATLAAHAVAHARAAARLARRLSVPRPHLVRPEDIARRARLELEGILLAQRPVLTRGGVTGDASAGLVWLPAWSLPGALAQRASEGHAPSVAELSAWTGLEPVRAARLLRRAEASVEAARKLPEWAVEPQDNLSGRIAGWMQRVVLKNLDMLVQEIRETGELAQLLAKAGSGNALTPEEWAKVREQLMDVVKAVPSLAVFALPGGAVLLPLLLKVLPFDLRPSSFRGTPVPRPVEGRQR